jgi:glycine cleavage system H lipoate-binding protein/ABC-type phosphate transport system substrate-binding protein
MKRIIYLLISLLLINYSNAESSPFIPESNNLTSDSIKVISTPDLYNLTNLWANEYNKMFPGSKLEIIRVSDSRMANDLLERGAIGFTSNEYFSGFDNGSIWKVVVGRDVIVPVINSKNPFLEEISRKGITPESFTDFFNNSDSRTWGTLLKGDQKSNAGLFVINDNSISKSIAGFLGTEAISDYGIKVNNAGELLSNIQKDPYAIGFCKLVSIMDPENRELAADIRLLPIDRNGNGLIDYNEKIYDNFNDFSRGVWIGKYPKALVSNIYSVSSDRPENKTEVDFLKWILNDGQKFLYSVGYSDLLISERRSTSDKLFEAQVYQSATMNDKSIFKSILIILASLVLAGFVIDMLFRFVRKRKTTGQITIPSVKSALDENSLIVPKGLYYDKTHTWAFMEQNGIVKVGVDDFLQHITGNLTRVILKNPGDKVNKGDKIMTVVQNGKQLDLYSPVSGVIKKQNEKVLTDSSLINSSPYSDGWVYMIEPENWLRENQLLFMAEKHKQFIKNEFSRLKDFLAEALTSDKEKYAQVILQDGGEIIDNTLSHFGPEVWEDFQLKYIDPSRQIWFYELF